MELSERIDDLRIAVGLEALEREWPDPGAGLAARVSRHDLPRRLTAAVPILLGVSVVVWIALLAPIPREIPGRQDRALVAVEVDSVDELEALPRDVRAVRLRGVGLFGEPLTRLPRLEHLEIELGAEHTDKNAYIAGSTLRWVADCKKLRRLTFDHVLGPPVELLSSLPTLEHLALLSCDGFQLEHARALRELPALTSLDLGNCRGVDDPVLAELAKLRGLRELSLAGATHSASSAGLTVLGALHELRALDLSMTDIRAPGDPLESFIAVMDRSDAPPIDVDDSVLESFATCTELRRLVLRDWAGFTSKGLIALAEAAPIEELVISNNPNVDDAIWEPLAPTLRSIDAAGCERLGRDVPAVMPALESWAFALCPEFGDRAIERMVAWPRLTSLWLLLVPITEDSLPHLGRLKLEHLTLAMVPWLDDAALAVFAKMKTLTALNVSGSRPSDDPANRGVHGMHAFSDAAVRGLAGLPELETLHLQYNRRLRVATLAALAACPLNLLNLEGTAVAYDAEIPDRAALAKRWPRIRILPER